MRSRVLFWIAFCIVCCGDRQAQAAKRVALVIGNSLRNLRSFDRVGDPNGYVDPGLEQIDIFVGKIELGPDIGETLKEIGQYRRDMQSAEGCGRCYAERAGGRVSQADDARFSRSDGSQYFDDIGVEACARFGQLHAAC